MVRLNHASQALFASTRAGCGSIILHSAYRSNVAFQHRYRMLLWASYSTTRALRKQNGRAFATTSNTISVIPPESTDSFLPGGAQYVDEMYCMWRRDPLAVHISWQTFFRNIEDHSVPVQLAFHPPPGLVSGYRSGDARNEQVFARTSISDDEDIHKAQKIIEAFQRYGHLRAKVNPLGSTWNIDPTYESKLPEIPNLKNFRLGPDDLNRQVRLGGELLPDYMHNKSQSMSFHEIFETCESIYCGSIGAEFYHISDPVKRNWIRNRLEDPARMSYTKEDRKAILSDIARATNTEKFLAVKFPNEKRFGLDGAEGLAPGLAALIDRSVDSHGVCDIVVGSCHRGRMNLISNVYGGTHEVLFRHFAGTMEIDEARGETGDVKYHYGVEGDKTTAAGNEVHVSILPNPSHLECISPVAQGKAKAKQIDQVDIDQSKVMHLTLHGDASLSGQGPVYETLNLASLSGYEVGGTIRIAVNNQIGFTTNTQNSRSTMYCTDIAKYIEAPILHVNGDDPDAVVFACRLAADWRATFKSDIVIDFVCYRRFGHNEIDQASFTQPEMYKEIAQQRSLLDKYSDNLVKEGVITAAEVEALNSSVWSELETCLARSKEANSSTSKNVLPRPNDNEASSKLSLETASDQATLDSVMSQISAIPEDFTIHSNLNRIIQGQKKDFEAGNIGWSTAEALAFGSLLLEGHAVRISGQDVERGTFSQRHSVLHDQKTYQEWIPLNSLEGKQATYMPVNSPLSEFGVLGFDYGYSLAARSSLVIWEAQFGDFANNAQVIIDQFIASAEAKWGLESGLVLSLAHGYDGQGPEHSSARIGRFLELCNEDAEQWPTDAEEQRARCNMQVVYMTTPANLFHVLRRQVRLPRPKPLVIFFSKSLLRHPLARSSIADLTESTSSFQPVLPDPSELAPHVDIDRIILCSGQIFTALHKHRSEHNSPATAILRIEELHPFPYSQVKDVFDQYPNAKEIVWCQEEPYNGGMWHYMRDRLEVVLRETEHHKDTKLRYAGRKASAATATGKKSTHTRELEEILGSAFRTIN